MADWHWITDRIALGSEPSARDIAAMRRQGITDVLDLRGEPRQREPGPQPEMYEGTGITYHYVGMLDRGTAQPAEKYVTGVQIIHDVLADPARKILVHCAAGISRGPSMVYAFLRSTGMSDAEAWDLINDHRRVATRQYFDSVQRAVAQLPAGPSTSGGGAIALAAVGAAVAYFLLR